MKHIFRSILIVILCVSILTFNVMHTYAFAIPLPALAKVVAEMLKLVGVVAVSMPALYDFSKVVRDTLILSEQVKEYLDISIQDYLDGKTDGIYINDVIAGPLSVAINTVASKSFTLPNIWYPDHFIDNVYNEYYMYRDEYINVLYSGRFVKTSGTAIEMLTNKGKLELILVDNGKVMEVRLDGELIGTANRQSKYMPIDDGYWFVTINFYPDLLQVYANDQLIAHYDDLYVIGDTNLIIDGVDTSTAFAEISVAASYSVPYEIDVSNVDVQVGTYVDLTGVIARTDAPSIENPLKPIEYEGKFTYVTTKFPFSLPWDIAHIYSLLTAEPKTPAINIDLQYMNMPFKINIDLSFLDPYMPYFRSFITISFAFFLVINTRKILGGGQ